jgi:GT2 family glycosyltransferase/tetratricopeptide (TPR) repeat protein
MPQPGWPANGSGARMADQLMELQRLEATAAAAEAQQDWLRAESLWRQLLQAQSQHGAAWHRLGKVLAQQERWANALQCQQTSCQHHPELGWNWFAAGEALEQLGNGEAAARAYREAAWRLPQESWIPAVAHKAEQRQWRGGEDLSQGLGPQSYRHWCERLEPALPPPHRPLRDHWWRPEGQNLWARVNADLDVVERQQGIWPSGAGWVLMLAADAQLRREALQAMEDNLTEGAIPPDLAYPDEDRLNREGQRHDPWFKPGWVPESFWSSPWLEACSVWRLEWLRAQRFAAPPMHDPVALFTWQLRALEAQPKVLSIPRVLVHRQDDGRLPAVELQARAKVLQENLRQQGEAVTVRPHGELGQFRLQWALPPSRPAVQVVIPTKDQAGLLSQCLESVERTCESYPELHITVVDHASQEEATTLLLQRWRQRLGPRFQVIRMGGPFNWSRLNNKAIHSGRAPLVLLMNNDVEAIDGGWLEAMAAQAMRPAVGAAGAILLYPSGTIQHAGIILGYGKSKNAAVHAYRGLHHPSSSHRNRSQLLTGWAAVTGACMMIQKHHWRAIGRLNERLPVEYNDVDLCLRLQEQGLRNVIEPSAILIHHECQSRDPHQSRTAKYSLERIQKKFPLHMSLRSPWWPKATSSLCVDGRPKELDTYN